MITVTIAPELLDQTFQQGHVTRSFRVTRGLPIGATFLGCCWNHDRQWIEVQFFDPEDGPDRHMEITFQTLSHMPSSLHPLVQLDEQLRRTGGEGAAIERDTR